MPKDDFQLSIAIFQLIIDDSTNEVFIK